MQQHEESTTQSEQSVDKYRHSQYERFRRNRWGDTARPFAQGEAQAIEEALATLEYESKRRKRRRRRMILAVSAYFAIMAIITFYIWIQTGKFNAHLFNGIASMSGMIGGFMAVSRAQKRATKEIAKYEDVRAVGPLAEALEFQDKEIRREAEQALCLLLPQMRASDAPLLNGDQRKPLYRALKGKNVDLVRAILTAFEQVGDSQAIPSVQRLAHGEGILATNEEIQKAAKSCQGFLEDRAQQEQARQTLLRASNPTIGASDALLRPATETEQIDPDQLLRASVEEATP